MGGGRALRLGWPKGPSTAVRTDLGSCPLGKYLTLKKLSIKDRKLIFIPPPQSPPLWKIFDNKIYLKWTLDNVQSFIEQHAVPDTQQYTVNLYLSNNEKYIVVLNSDNFLHCCPNINIPKSPCLKKTRIENSKLSARNKTTLSLLDQTKV